MFCYDLVVKFCKLDKISPDLMMGCFFAHEGSRRQMKRGLVGQQRSTSISCHGGKAYFYGIRGPGLRNHFVCMCVAGGRGVGGVGRLLVLQK